MFQYKIPEVSARIFQNFRNRVLFVCLFVFCNPDLFKKISEIPSKFPDG